MRPARPQPALPAIQQVRIDRIGADGDGVGQLGEGRPVYVAGALPGELIRVRPTAKRGEGWSGVVDELLEPSADRVIAPCVHFGTCGGCTLQHWRSASYLAWKTALLDGALRRAGFSPEIAPIVVTAPGVRRRMDLAVRRQGGAITVGLHEMRSAAVVDLRECHVLHPDLAALIGPLRDMLRGLSAIRREGSVVVNLLDSGGDMLLRTDAPATSADRTRLAAFAARHGMPRITLAEGRAALETACLLRPPTTRFGNVDVAPPPGAFLQASQAGEQAIVAAVLAGLPAKLPARARVAELYAGCGALTFALASHVRIAAFEGDAASVAAMRTGINANALGGRIEPNLRDLSRQPLSARELAAFAAALLDPPHAGAIGQIETLAASGVARIVYVSCNPQTLARDAAVLRSGGYQLASATPIDQFLWSSRLESVVVFTR